MPHLPARSVPVWAEMVLGTGPGRAGRTWSQGSDAQDQGWVVSEIRVQFVFAPGVKSVGCPNVEGSQMLRGNLPLSVKGPSGPIWAHLGPHVTMWDHVAPQ